MRWLLKRLKHLAYCLVPSCIPPTPPVVPALDQQAAVAATREECKRWLDQDIVDRYYKEREEARDREELERQTRVKQNAVNAVKTLEVQVRGG